MKIIIPQLGLSYFDNIARCLQTTVSKPGINMEIILWNPNVKSMIDLFDELQPDLIFLHEQILRPEINIVLEEFDFRYVLACGRPNDQLTRRPDVVLTNKEATIAFDPSYKTLVTEPVADTISMHLSEYDKRCESDILMFTHPNIQFTDNLIAMTEYLCHNYRTKIVGNGPIDSYHYLGRVTPAERASFIKSTKLVVDFGSYEFLDASSAKIPSVIFTPPPEAQSPLSSSFRSFLTLKELKDHVESLLSTDSDYESYSQSCQEALLTNKATSYHATSEIFALLGETHIANTLLDTIKEFVS